MKLRSLICLLMLNSPLLAAEPLTQFFENVITFHQKVISPIDGPRSHFVPCSSTYTRQAIRHYGLVKGLLKGADRLMRENSDPWVYKSKEIDGLWVKLDPIV